MPERHPVFLCYNTHMMKTQYIVIAYIIWNIIVFLTYGYDKHQAVKDRWRVPEKTLIGLALFLGGIGAWFGMQGFRHKTKKPLFKYGVPVCILINIICMLYLFNINIIGWWLSGR